MFYSVQMTASIIIHVIFVGVFISIKESAVTLEPTTNCTDQTIPEGESLTCACRAPPSVSTPVTLSWPGHSDTSILTVDSVRRDDHGTVFTCLMEGQGLERNTTYTLRVAYGPSRDSVTITGPSPFVTDGTRNLTLTCEAGDMYPPPSYGWGRLCSTNTETCTLTPKLDQDGERVLCTVFNPAISTTVSKYYILKLELPTSSGKTKSPGTVPALVGGICVVVVVVGVIALAIYLWRKKSKRRSGTHDRQVYENTTLEGIPSTQPTNAHFPHAPSHQQETSEDKAASDFHPYSNVQFVATSQPDVMCRLRSQLESNDEFSTAYLENEAGTSHDHSDDVGPLHASNKNTGHTCDGQIYAGSVVGSNVTGLIFPDGHYASLLPRVDNAVYNQLQL